MPDRLHKADAIVVLRGEEYFRMGKGVELYKQGYAPFLITSVTPKTLQPFDMTARMTGYDQLTETEITHKIFKYFDMDPKAVLLTEHEVTSTYQEALATKELALKKGFHALLLVTSTYHMRRSLWTFGEVFKGSGITLDPVTAPNQFYDPLRWWTHERDVRRVIEEYGSLVFNWIYHFVLQKHSSSFDTV